jgi:hypothetical protein
MTGDLGALLESTQVRAALIQAGLAGYPIFLTLIRQAHQIWQMAGAGPRPGSVKLVGRCDTHIARALHTIPRSPSGGIYGSVVTPDGSVVKSPWRGGRL